MLLLGDGGKGVLNAEQQDDTVLDVPWVGTLSMERMRTNNIPWLPGSAGGPCPILR